MSNKKDDWFGKDMGFTSLEEFEELTRRGLESNDERHIQAIRDIFNAQKEYLNYPENSRSPERDEYANRSIEIIERIASELGLRI
ncbi:MAG: hypothetical protein AAF849_15440 [Bacteroidota bacterium]